MKRMLLLLVAGLMAAGSVHAQSMEEKIAVARTRDCCDVEAIGGMVWHGSDRTMTFKQLASYCAPILWFSPDEPLLDDRTGQDILIPTFFPNEEGVDRPVGYFRIRTIITTDGDGEPFTPDPYDRADAVINLDRVDTIDLDFFYYYPSEEGLGGHTHDVESVEMKVAVFRRPECPTCPYSLVVLKTTGKAHGILWYDNTLNSDQYTRFPMTILVEEGKHASCTDKNGDGYYTPGYDVNERVNDAWGVRDIIRGGALFAGGFQSWFAKVRVPDGRVFPPLPEDSPLLERYQRKGKVYGAENAIYELRAFPRPEAAIAYDPELTRFVEKGDPNWPQVVAGTDLREFGRWLDEESFLKSLSVSFRVDGDGSENKADFGVSFVFPLLIFKNVSDPMGGGWLVNRIYLKDKDLRDFAWTILYTTSASRWIDGYLSAGVEWDDNGEFTEDHMVTETGVKFRANIGHSPLSFLSKLTDFWGLRAGVKYTGFFNFSRIGYVFEIGAGTW